MPTDLDQIFDYIYSKPDTQTQNPNTNSLQADNLNSPKRQQALNLINAYKNYGTSPSSYNHNNHHHQISQEHTNKKSYNSKNLVTESISQPNFDTVRQIHGQINTNTTNMRTNQTNIISSQAVQAETRIQTKQMMTNNKNNRSQTSSDTDDDYALFEKAQEKIDKLHGGLKPAYSKSFHNLHAESTQQNQNQNTFQKTQNHQNYGTTQGSNTYTGPNHFIGTGISTLSKQRYPSANTTSSGHSSSKSNVQVQKADFSHDKAKAPAQLTESEKQEILKNRKQKFNNKFSLWENRAKEEESAAYNEEILKQQRFLSKNLNPKPFFMPKKVDIYSERVRQQEEEEKQARERMVQQKNILDERKRLEALTVQTDSTSKNREHTHKITGLKQPSPTRKMKIIIQQKPNLPTGFGFTLKIAPGRTIIVDNLTKNGSADKCGLKLNDEVELLNDHPCNMFSMRELEDVIRNAVYKGKISLMICRSKEERDDGQKDVMSPSNKSVDTTTYGFVYKPPVPNPPTQIIKKRVEPTTSNTSENPFKASRSRSNSTKNLNSSPVSENLPKSDPRNRHKSSDSSNFGSKILTDSAEVTSQHRHERSMPSSEEMVYQNSGSNHSNPNLQKIRSERTPGISSSNGTTNGTEGDDTNKWYKELGLLEDNNSPRPQVPQLPQPIHKSYSGKYVLSNNIGILSSNENVSQNKSRNRIPSGHHGQVIKYRTDSHGSGATYNSIQKEELELQIRKEQRRIEEEEAMRIAAEQERETLAIQRMELDAREAEQKARLNRERYEQQMKKIDNQLKDEENRLRKVKQKRQEVEKVLKKPYNYEDYAVIYPKNFSNGNSNNNNNKVLAVNRNRKESNNTSSGSNNSFSKNSNEQNVPPGEEYDLNSKTSYQPRFYYQNGQQPHKNLNDHWLIREADKKFEQDFNKKMNLNSNLNDNRQYSLEEYTRNYGQEHHDNLNENYEYENYRKSSVEEILNDPSLQATLL